MLVFPKTLLGFYMRYAVRPYLAMTVIFMLLFIIVRVGFSLLYPFYNKWFIELFEQSAPAGMSFVQFALPTIVMILGISLLLDVINVIQNLLQGYVNARARNNISIILHRYVNQQSMRFFYSRYPGKIAKQIQYVCDGYLTRRVFKIFANILILILGGGLMLMLDWRFGIMLSGMLIFRMIYGIWRMFPMNKATHNTSEASSSLSGVNIDSISNFSIVKLFAGAGREEAHAQTFRKTHVEASLYQRFMERCFWVIPGIIHTFLFGMTMLVCVTMYQNGEIAVAGIVFTMSMFWSVTNQIDEIVDAVPELTDLIGSAQQSYSELIQPVEIKDAPNAKTLTVSRGEIEFKNISFSYGGRDVVHDFNLTIQPGEKVGLVGVSGAGKTTLVNLLMRFYDTKRGKILIDGKDIAKVTQDSLRESIAFIPQEPTMFNRTLADNIAYGKPGATEQEIKNAAQSADADRFIMDTKDGYQSLVGDRGVKLSGGQRQRIAIARAFLKDAPILVLDEATSALDSETELAVQKSFAELSKGRTTLVIAHRLSTLRHMDRIVVMEEGHIMESGTHQELLEQGGTYAKLWDMQSGGFLQE